MKTPARYLAGVFVGDHMSKNLKKLKIIGIGEPFDGLTVYVDQEQWDDYKCRWELSIKRIEKKSMLFDTFSYPISDGFNIDRRNLRDIDDDEPIEFGTDNPYGVYIREFIIGFIDGKSYATVYENAIVIRILALNNKVLYSRSFIGKNKRREVLNIMGSMNMDIESVHCSYLLEKLVEIQ